MNRWHLTEEVKIKFTPIVEQFIGEVENIDIEERKELLEKDFSDTELNPSRLGELLEELGYEEENRNDNGWELDFDITMIKEGHRPLVIRGCGMTFELMLCELD